MDNLLNGVEVSTVLKVTSFLLFFFFFLGKKGVIKKYFFFVCLFQRRRGLCTGRTAGCRDTMMGGTGPCGSCLCLVALIPPKFLMKFTSAKMHTQMLTFAAWLLTTSNRCNAWPSSFKNLPTLQPPTLLKRQSISHGCYSERRPPFPQQMASTHKPYSMLCFLVCPPWKE